ncbi:protein kinase [Ectothiorhodospira haloalkaliphila]|uniref:NERD domain-containing protein kinase family protein n=1 Tax=Ectothiorhodospira haloalkaliphila TaxID=421628 RepID=UPI001EE81162|nr:NERD domain-containing protein kinase family protein [Ectothiorhodospira haloalkaliphila]MCG5523614.1 protein kinase [Ectothiorhodospira haloalkaliphila]
MKPYDHCEFAHERKAFDQLYEKVPSRDDLALYPSVYIPDPGRKIYLECDLLVISPTFAAVVELKHWRGEIDVEENVWRRDGVTIRDPHEVNLPKAKVFKGLLEQALPAARIPFVQSIVVLTNSDASVRGADSAFDLIKTISDEGHRLSDHLTFDGVDEIAKYLRERLKREAVSGRKLLTSHDFKKIKYQLDQRFTSGIRRKDYVDQISGYSIRQEIEHTARYVSYLAQANPARGDTLYRLRVFGPVSSDPAEQARQYRSLDILSNLRPHPNIRSAQRHPNERNLVVEVCPWNEVKTLDQILEDGIDLSIKFILNVVRSVALALAHIHEDSRLIHRNLTPRSVIIGRDDHVELTDFDLVFDAAAEYTVMNDELSEIERHYLAPEALAGCPDLASDIYSLGRLLIQMLDSRDSRDDAIEDLCALAESMSNSDMSARPTAKYIAEHLSDYVESDTQDEQVNEPSLGCREPRIGDTHDTWELIRELGRGGSSWVFYGESHGLPVTIKIFRDDVPRARCLAERDFLHSINSPFIASFRTFSLWGGCYWCIVQEYVAGEALGGFIERGERPSIEQFLELAQQMLTALDTMHTCPTQNNDSANVRGSIIHNDVTPGNIVLNKERCLAKLIDFGLASSPGMTEIGGTPGYVARDLVTKEGYQALPQGDLYSLAVTLVEWSTGQRPSSAEEVPLLFSEELPSAVSEGLTEVLRRALGSGDQRFTSAQEMQLAIDAAMSESIAVPFVQTIEEHAPASANTKTKSKVAPSNRGAEGFVEYLNTIHNVSADNRHALAEAQATSPYFRSLHVELDLTKSIDAILSAEKNVVIMLTGHAGDGKSTVAVDLLKRARDLPPNEALPEPPHEVEKVALHGSPLTIVKDMSELSARDRLIRLREAMESVGNSVIVSNTGPLLSTFSHFFSQGDDRDQVEQNVLRALSEPLVNGALSSRNCFTGFGGEKVFIANLSMLSNVGTAVKLFGKLVDHQAWDDCTECYAAKRCSIRGNVELLRESLSLVQTRVRYIYERLSAYGRRMTMRQLAAHLSFSLTGGLNCKDIMMKPDSKCIQSVFSESFFGHFGERTSQAVDSLFCLKQMEDLYFGAQSTPQFDQFVLEGKLTDAVEFPSRLRSDVDRLQQEAHDQGGGEARRRLRRLAYMFGNPRADCNKFESILIDEFLRSSMLRTLDRWARQGSVGAGLEKMKYIKKTVGVLMEEYIGCMVPECARERLFITLRRPDERVFQTVQIVLKAIPLDEFDLIFDSERALPVLTHGQARLELTLPLLDYIDSRSQGVLTGELDAIHRASLESFRGELLGQGERLPDNEVITLLENNAEGEVKIHKFSVDGDQRRLVYQ